MEVNTLDPSMGYQSSGMVKSQSVGTISTLRKEDGQRVAFVDRGVGFPRIVKSSSFNIIDPSLDPDTKVCIKDFQFLLVLSNNGYSGTIVL